MREVSVDDPLLVRAFTARSFSLGGRFARVGPGRWPVPPLASSADRTPSVSPVPLSRPVTEARRVLVGAEDGMATARHAPPPGRGHQRQTALGRTTE